MILRMNCIIESNQRLVSTYNKLYVNEIRIKIQSSRLDTNNATQIKEMKVKLGDGKLCEPNDGLVEIEIP